MEQVELPKFKKDRKKKKFKKGLDSLNRHILSLFPDVYYMMIGKPIEVYCPEFNMGHIDFKAYSKR